MPPKVKVVGRKATGADSYKVVEAEVEGWDVARALDALVRANGVGSYILDSLTAVR